MQLACPTCGLDGQRDAGPQLGPNWACKQRYKEGPRGQSPTVNSIKPSRDVNPSRQPCAVSPTRQDSHAHEAPQSNKSTKTSAHNLPVCHKEHFANTPNHFWRAVQHSIVILDSHVQCSPQSSANCQLRGPKTEQYSQLHKGSACGFCCNSPQVIR